MSFRKTAIYTVIAALTAGAALLLINGARPFGDLKDETFRNLRTLRESKKKEITAYFNNLKILAEGFKNEPEVTRFFHEMENTQLPDQELLDKMDILYSSKYYQFYDILFVNLDGLIFHSIKMEEDYKTNLFTGKFSNTELARSIKKDLETKFVDFSYYLPSAEPASFFIVPVPENGSLNGWIILQTPLNMINVILSRRLNKSRTMEVYLINNQGIMLSDSRFYEDSTAMKININSYAVQSILKKQAGEQIINDYRGISVFSSFDKFKVLGSEWGIIAEIDKAEVITEYYKKHKKYLLKEIFKYLEKNKEELSLNTEDICRGNRVDVGEYQRVLKGSALWTTGVSTCTAAAVLYSDKFGYLSHITPADDIYVSGKLTKYFLKNSYSNLLDDIIRKINKFEITPSENRNVYFFLASPDHAGFKKALDKILGNGNELENIVFMYNPEMKSVTMQLDLANNCVNLRWNDGNSFFFNDSSDFNNLGFVVEKIIHF